MFFYFDFRVCHKCNTFLCEILQRQNSRIQVRIYESYTFLNNNFLLLHSPVSAPSATEQFMTPDKGLQSPRRNTVYVVVLSLFSLASTILKKVHLELR